MLVINDIYKGDITLSDDLTLSGIIQGCLYVGNGRHAVIHGQVIGDLIIGEGSKVDVHGQVIGRLIMDGGSAYVGGMIIGSVVDPLNKINFSENAVITSQ